MIGIKLKDGADNVLKTHARGVGGKLLMVYPFYLLNVESVCIPCFSKQIIRFIFRLYILKLSSLLETYFQPLKL